MCKNGNETVIWNKLTLTYSIINKYNKNSSGDDIPNVNFYAVRPDLPEFADITQNNAIAPFKVIQGHRFWYQSKAHIRCPVSD